MSRYIGAEIVREALQRMPKVATQTLARSLYAKYPEVWPNREACRSSIRAIRGVKGIRLRKDVTRRMERSEEEARECRRWGMVLPDPEPTDFEWYDLPLDVKRWLIISDIHVPYFDKRAVETCFEFADGQVDGVLINGDGIDCYQLSNFCKDPRKMKPKDEIAAWMRFLDAVQSLHGLKRVIWKEGNHELRLGRYLLQKAPELFEMEQFSWNEICNLDERGIQWLGTFNPIRHHHLTILHGHEWGNRFSNPVNQARGAFLRANDCTLEGHGHRTSHHTETTLRGRNVSCWSIGCLCNMKPEYRPLANKWNHGFACLVASKDPDKWKVENYRVIDGKVVL